MTRRRRRWNARHRSPRIARRADRGRATDRAEAWEQTASTMSADRASRAVACPSVLRFCRPRSSSQASTRAKFWQQWSIWLNTTRCGRPSTSIVVHFGVRYGTSARLSPRWMVVFESWPTPSSRTPSHGRQAPEGLGHHSHIAGGRLRRIVWLGAPAAAHRRHDQCASRPKHRAQRLDQSGRTVLDRADSPERGVDDQHTSRANAKRAQLIGEDRLRDCGYVSHQSNGPTVDRAARIASAAATASTTVHFQSPSVNSAESRSGPNPGMCA